MTKSDRNLTLPEAIARALRIGGGRVWRVEQRAYGQIKMPICTVHKHGIEFPGIAEDCYYGTCYEVRKG